LLLQSIKGQKGNEKMTTSNKLWHGVLGCIVMLVGAVTTGCAIIDKQIAMGSDPSAEAAAQRITDDEVLMKVGRFSQNEKARVLAVKKLSNERKLFWLLAHETNHTVRVAAAERSIELGIAEKIIQGTDQWQDSALYPFVTGKSLPEDLREKAIKAWSTVLYDDDNIRNEALKDIIWDDAEPINVRKAAIKKAKLNTSEYVEILNSAADKKNSLRANYEILARAYDKGMDSIICDNFKLNIPLEARKLAFSFLEDEKEICQILKDIAELDRSEREANLRSIDMQLARYAIEATAPEMMAKFFDYIRDCHTNEGRMMPFLLEASKRISNESILIKIAEQGRLQEYAPELARGIAIRIKSMQYKAKREAIIARCGSDAKECAEALVSLYSEDPDRAYGVVRRWLVDDKENQRVLAIEDVDTLIGLVKLCKNDKLGLENSRHEMEQKLKAGILHRLELKIEMLSAEKLTRLVESTQAKAEELMKSGNVCVIGNYYLKMPALCFIALAKMQDIKAVPLDWEWDDETKRVIMTGIAFDSKNLYKATGLEKAEAKYELPRKLGVAPFEVGMTRVRYNRNYFAEAMGSYDFNTVSGGDVYYRSETRAKNIVLCLWEGSGRLVMSQLD